MDVSLSVNLQPPICCRLLLDPGFEAGRRDLQDLSAVSASPRNLERPLSPLREGPPQALEGGIRPILASPRPPTHEPRQAAPRNSPRVLTAGAIHLTLTTTTPRKAVAASYVEAAWRVFASGAFKLPRDRPSTDHRHIFVFVLVLIRDMDLPL